MLDSQQPSTDRPRVDRRIVLLSIVGFWLFYFTINSTRAALLHWGNEWPFIKARAVVSLMGIGLVYLAYLIMRRLEGKSMQVLVAAAFLTAMPISVMYASFNYVAFYVVAPMEVEPTQSHSSHESETPAVIISDLALSWYFFVVAWSALYVALSYAARVQAAERNVALYRAQAQNAQLRALRYQINPHFLFNTLNSLSTLIMRRRSDEAEKMLINLASFFRASLTDDPTEDITLIEEIKMQRLYLEIEQSRFPDRLRVNIEVPPELEQAAIPGFILQPLVENAIKYGVSRSLRPVTIVIRAESNANSLFLSVEDDGEPMIPLIAAGTGVGLRNVRDRLIARFGDDAQCDYGPKPGGGFRVSLAIPLMLQRALAAS